MIIYSSYDYLFRKCQSTKRQLELIKIIQEGDKLKKFTKLSYNLELPVEKDTGSSFHSV